MAVVKNIGQGLILISRNEWLESHSIRSIPEQRPNGLSCCAEDEMFAKSIYGKVSVFTRQQCGRGNRFQVWEWPDHVLILGSVTYWLYYLCQAANPVSSSGE